MTTPPMPTFWPQSSGLVLLTIKEPIMDRAAFYDAIRGPLGGLTEPAVAGFELVLSEAEKRGTALPYLAYILATAWWETAHTMQPVREAFWKSDAWRRKNLRYHPFYGRGFVQLTWEANYRKASELYGVDFVANPDLAMQPEHAVAILFDGMEDGWFTGKDLDDTIDLKDESDAEDLKEYVAARRIVNGTDKALEIGKLGLVFERGLKAAEYPWASAEAKPAEVPKPTPRPVPIEEVKDAEAIRYVQQRLRELRYPEVGEVDGKMGERTRNTIKTFQANNSLAEDGRITAGLIQALLKAKPREIGAARATATVSDIKDATGVVVAKAQERGGIGGVVAGTVGAVVAGGVTIDDLTSAVTTTQRVMAIVGSVGPWVVLAAVCGLVVWLARKQITNQIEQYRTGNHV